MEMFQNIYANCCGSRTNDNKELKDNQILQSSDKHNKLHNPEMSSKLSEKLHHCIENLKEDLKIQA